MCLYLLHYGYGPWNGVRLKRDLYCAITFASLLSKINEVYLTDSSLSLDNCIAVFRFGSVGDRE